MELSGVQGKGEVLWCHPRITQPNIATELTPHIEPIKLHSLYYSLQFHIHRLKFYIIIPVKGFLVGDVGQVSFKV